MPAAREQFVKGDVVVVDGHRVGERGRIGEVLAVVHSVGIDSYRVRWEDGHESIFFPSSDASLKHVTHEHAAAPRAKKG